MPEFVYRRVVQCHGCISIWSRYSSGLGWTRNSSFWLAARSRFSILTGVCPQAVSSLGLQRHRSGTFGRMVSGKNRGPLARITIELPACHCLAFPPCSHDRVAERRKIRSLDIVEQAVWLIGEFAVGGGGIYTSSLPHLSAPDTPSRHKCRSIV